MGISTSLHIAWPYTETFPFHEARLHRHREGSHLISAAGTTVGAGILAVPFTTQDSGFIPSSASLFGTYVFSIVTGLLLAEANVNLMCELGKVSRLDLSCAFLICL